MKYLKIVLLIVLITNILNAKDLRKVTLKLSWLHQFQFAGYYMAKEKGFYEELGLDVDIQEFTFTTNQLEEVTNGKVDFAIGKSSLIIDRLEGKDVVALSAIFQHSPLMLLTRKDSNITKPQDLFNKRVMLTPEARIAVAIHSMLVSKGVGLNDVKFQAHTFKLQDLIDGKTDAMGCYLSNEPYLMKQKKIEYNILHPKDYGFDFYGGLLFTSQKFLNNNPILVRDFYDATLKGWEYAFSNIKETTDLILEKYNTQKKSKDALIYEGEVLKELAEFEEGNLGKIDKSKIDEIKKIYLLLGFSTENEDLMKNFIYNPNKVILSKKEKSLDRNLNFYLEEKRPFLFEEDSKLNGIVVDIWKDIEEKLNLNTVYKKVEQNDMLFDKNSLKLVISKKDIDNNKIYSDKIDTYKVAIATKVNTSFVYGLSHFNGKKIAVNKDFLLIDRIKKDYPEIVIVKTETINEALNLLANSQVEAVVDTLHTLSYKINNLGFSNLKISGTTRYSFPLFFMANKEDKILIDVINKSIKALDKKRLNEIKNRWLLVEYSSAVDYSLIYKIGVPLILILLFIMYNNAKLKEEIKKRTELEKDLYRLANTDPLTKVYNRRKGNELIQSNIASYNRYENKFSLIFFDIDFFKKINDNFGHDLADTVLIDLTKLVIENIRNTDSLVRWGGEEFLIILQETDKNGAEILAENLRQKVQSFKFQIDKEVTCSFGVVEYGATDNYDSILKRSDALMYLAKEQGRNRVVVES